MKQISPLHIILALVFGVSYTAQAQLKKVLIVSTNVDSLQGDANGTFLMEIAYPLDEFAKAGIEVDVVTPKGGKAAIYHRGKMDSSLSVIRDSEWFIQKINLSLAAKRVNPEQYAGIFFPGGGGQFYDVWNDERIAAIAAVIYENGGVIGAAGHGVVSLLNIKLSNGKFLIKGKKITCFPKSISAKWLPVDWEQELKDKGATVVLPVTADEKENGIQLKDNEGRVMSGSYAENAAWVAQQMILFIRKQ